ncbi:MAG: PD-(D/E)XK nuclease family protein [Thermodesulfovibrionales bacterium]|nr:PD-(D/E)XK nuclease family protein [Thermodesulfovibrionales bacterium]
MSIKVFYIPFRYRGSTETLLKVSVDKIKGPDYSRILYIAPTPRKVRDAQRIFHGLIGGCYIPPEMMTIKQLSKRLYSLYGDRNVISQHLMPVVISQISGKGMGFASLITDFINEIKQYHPGKGIETIRKELKAIFYELGIPEEVSSRAMEAIEIFKVYQEILERQSVLDEDDVMAACPRLIKGHNWSPETLILDGFYELTRSEEAILKALIENTKDILISIPHDINFSEITNGYGNFIKNNFKSGEVYLSTEEKAIEPFYYPYPGMEEEAEGIARCIKNYFISGKIRDLEKVIVTFPKLYEYSDIVERIFRRYGIPHTISISKPAGKSRPFLDFIVLLESVADDYPRLPFSRFLSSPYFKNIPSGFREWIPMLCLRSGIIKGKDAWLNLSKTVSSLPSKIEKGLRWVFKKLAPLESIRNKGSYSQYSEVIGDLLNDLDFSGVSSQEADLKEKAISVLKELSFIENLTPYNSRLKFQDLRQFIDALRHILNATDMEIEGTGVQVMGFFELRGIEPEYLYLGGLKEGDLPSKPDIDYILPDSVRTKFGLINLKKYLLLQRFIFSRTIESTKNPHLSYPVMEGDRFFLPSPLLPWNREKKELVSGIFSKEEELLGKGRRPFASYITEIEEVGEKLIRNKFGENSYIRVTDIDSYRTCPRKFFIEKVLQLEPPETKEYKVEAMLLGTIVHETMQLLLSKPFADVEDLRVKAEEIMESLLSDKPLENYWKKLIKDTFLSILPEIYELESSLIDEGYSFMKAEFTVEGEIIKGIRLKGKIDRVDKKVKSSKLKVQSSKDDKLVTRHSPASLPGLTPRPHSPASLPGLAPRSGAGREAGQASLATDTVELIDYKTGITQIRGSQVITKGATLQLFIYAALMKLLGFKVERVGIYSLKDINLSWIPGKNDRRDGRTIEDYIEASLRFLEEMILKIKMGNFSASPLSEQTCRNCSERPYCPYIQKTVKSEKLRVYGKLS